MDEIARKKARKFRLPIGTKLVGITVTLLLIVTTAIAWTSSEYFSKQVRETYEQSNDRQAENRTTEVEGLLNNYVDKIKIVSSLMYRQYATSKEKEEALDLTFKTDRDLIAIEIYELTNGIPTPVERIVNNDYLKSYGLSAEYLNQVRKVRPFPMNAVFAGKVEVMNSSLPKGAPLVTIGIPFVKDIYERVSHIAIADIRLDRLQKTFGTQQAAEIFLIDQNGIVLAHPDDKLPSQAASLKDNPLVDQTVNSKTRLNQIRSYINPIDDKPYYGISYRTPFNVSVIAQIPEEIITEPAKIVTRRAYYIGGIILSCALFFIFLFSITLTSPIERLLELTHEIAKGNFDVHAQVNIRSSDEVGDLAAAFDDMTVGLKEREKAMNVLSKTQGADVAAQLMNQNLANMGGTKKEVTVLFSDLRDFTKFSEGHTPEEVVEMLNEYFEVMVNTITRNKGTVNKFIGDAIMAMWGAPNSTGNDAANATMAALEMRVELNALNERRLARNQPPIKIGAGLHCGLAIAGTIGATSRMEYTIIGDTVNMASRIEASTKAFGADLLLSHEMYEKVKEFFILEYGGAAEVKGKSEALKMYKIRGYIDEDGKEVRIQTPYSDYKAEAADKVKVAA